jgi:hypothetical protein
VRFIQTFLPYPDFKKSAECLDYKRLGKQRVEASQIINILMREKAGEDISKIGWGNHPAVRMWRGCIEALMEYHRIIVEEWINRSYTNNMDIWKINPRMEYELPLWFGRKDFHDAHKSNLLRKDKKFYSKYKWNVPDNLKYKWK